MLSGSLSAMALNHKSGVFGELDEAVPAVPQEGPVTADSVPAAAAQKPSRWRVAMLLASSALLSGIAVVLWNRRTLERIREAAAETPPARPSSPDEFI